MRKIVNKIQKFQSAKPISTKFGIKEELDKLTEKAAGLNWETKTLGEDYLDAKDEFIKHADTFESELVSLQKEYSRIEEGSRQVLSDLQEAGLDKYIASVHAEDAISDSEDGLRLITDNINTLRSLKI